MGRGTPDNATPHSIFGGWFAELVRRRLGPSDRTALCDAGGRGDRGRHRGATTPYPYMSVRRDTGIEVGRIGALIGGPGQNIGRSCASNDPAYIAGAWFTELAVGGTDLADWRILAASGSERADAEHQHVHHRLPGQLLGPQ